MAQRAAVLAVQLERQQPGRAQAGEPQQASEQVRRPRVRGLVLVQGHGRAQPPPWGPLQE